MKWKATILIIGVLLGALITSAVGQRERDSRPWLQPAKPSQLEWLLLEQQAVNGINDFAKSGMLISFAMTPNSFQTGELECTIEYERDVSAAELQLTEDGIKRQFEIERRDQPWAHLKITKKAASF